jgi:hypothetical protein
LRKLQARVAQGKWKCRDTIWQRGGRRQERYPKARPFVTVAVTKQGKPALTGTWDVPRLRAAWAADGAEVLQSHRGGWTAPEFWETYRQGAVAERVFRVRKRARCLRPVWHPYRGRVPAQVFVGGVA